MKITRILWSSVVGTTIATTLSASASAQSPMFPTVQPIRPQDPYVSAVGPSVFMPPGGGVNLKPLAPLYRQPFPEPNRSDWIGPSNYPATYGYGSSPYIRFYGGAGTGP